MTPDARAAAAMSDASAGECCARAQAESWARAEARRFAPRAPGLMMRLRVLLERLGGGLRRRSRG
ncbi:MAG: hypothetical protein QMC09_11060 [Thauera sp.]